MAAIPLCEAPLAELKKCLLDEFDEVKSSHLSEALAAAMGFRTNAALKTALVGPEQDRPYALLNPERFLSRLVEFGYPLNPNDPEFDFEVWHEKAGVVSTMPSSAYEIEYKTTRSKAWRNLMVFAVNEALDRKLFSLRVNDNRFGDAEGRGSLFDFMLPNGLPVRGYVSDAGFGELNVHAAVNPIGTWIRAANAGFSAGDAVARGWLERERGAWLQTSAQQFHCRRGLLQTLADLHVEPQGYGDRGAVIL